jgi:hypothetical protein
MSDDTPGTQIGRLYRKLVQKEQPVTGLSDQARAERNDEITDLVGSLVRLPASTLTDVADKLAVLCSRLRAEGLSPTSPTGALTALLAESAQDDLKRLILRGTEGEGQNG